MASSFFKILLDPSADHMSLPPEFACMHVENKITNSPIIRSANGGYSWRLKIEQTGDGYYFVNGWNNMVEDIQLGFGDFLFFRLVDGSTFRMSIYSPDGCEKILQPKSDENFDEKNEEKEKSGDDDPFFVVIVTLTHARFLRFPGGFAELVGIKAEGTMKVKNLDGKEWVTGLKLDKSYRNTIRYYLSPGWSRFAGENKLAEGDECVFRFIRSEGKLLLAKVTKNKRSKPSGEIPVTEALSRSRARANHERGGDVVVDPDEERVEVMQKPFEMPPKRRCGPPPQQNQGFCFSETYERLAVF